VSFTLTAGYEHFRRVVMSEAKKAEDEEISAGTGRWAFYPQTSPETSTRDKVWTILGHIEAGHYPKDEKGRALVPMKNGRTALIYATDHAGLFSIVGSCVDRLNGRMSWYWRVDGTSGGLPNASHDLMPPTPRKGKVTGKLKRIGNGFVVWDLDGVSPDVWRKGVEIEFTGEVEEPWS
jgi:hypothetical protein